MQNLSTGTDMVISRSRLDQHALHLPIGIDDLNGLERAELVAQQTDVLVVRPSCCRVTRRVTWSLPGRPRYRRRSSSRVLRSRTEPAGAWLKRFLLLNAHGGNQAITRDIVERINQETAGIAVDLSEAVAPLLTRTTAATPFTGTVSRLKRPHSRLRSIVTAASEKRPPRYLTPTLVISTPRRPRR